MASMPDIEVTVNHDAATSALLAIRDMAEQSGGGLTSADRLAKIAGLAREALATAQARLLPPSCIHVTPEAVAAFNDGLRESRVAVSRIDLEIGTLKIRSGDLSSAFHGSEILVDGKPLRIRNIEIRGGIDELWTVKLEYLP